jgi:hypothetical protein
MRRMKCFVGLESPGSNVGSILVAELKWMAGLEESSAKTIDNTFAGPYEEGFHSIDIPPESSFA